MRYNISIDQVRSLKWGLNPNQSALYSLLTTVNTWADEIIIDNKVYYFTSRNMVIKEIPLYYQKPDTVYRGFLKLKEIDVIEYIKLGNKDLIRITEKGRLWNTNSSEYSEINPNKLGNKSELNSEINPTNNITNIDNITKDNIKEEKLNEKQNEKKSFDNFWNKYHQITRLAKTDKYAALNYWNRLNNEERLKAYDNIQLYYDNLPIYRSGKPIKKARTYLADKNFNDEFKNKNINENNNIVRIQKPVGFEGYS